MNAAHSLSFLQSGFLFRQQIAIPLSRKQPVAGRLLPARLLPLRANRHAAAC